MGMLTGEALFKALGKLHDAHPAGEETLMLGYIDGAMAALVLSPEPVPPEEWLPRLDLAPDTLFLSPEHAARWRELLLARQAEMVGSFLKGGLAFAPIYECDENDESIWQPWLAGFVGTMQLRKKAWDKLFRSKDEDLAAAVMGLISLTVALPGIAAKVPNVLGDMEEIGEIAENAADIIPYFVETIYRRQHGLPRVIMTDDWGLCSDWGDDLTDPRLPVRSTKVGRNEPCPCGSGKKYKKCCGREV